MSAPMTYRFGTFDLDASLYELRRDGIPLRVEPRVLDLLFFLVRNRDRIVTREELLDTLWKEKFIGEAALTRCVMEARKAIAIEGGEDAIKTIHRRGYRFVAAVVEESRAEAPVPTAPEPIPEPVVAEPPAREPVSRSRGIRTIALAAAVAVTVIAGTVAVLLRPDEQHPATAEATMLRVSSDLKITRVTTSAKATDAAISPDGKYVAYVIDHDGMRSIRMRQIATGSDTELVAGDRRQRMSLTFTPDGSYVAYLEEQEPGVWSLHRIPTLGGMTKRWVDSIEASVWSKGKDIAFTADGERIAFVRRVSPGRTALYVSQLGRGEERQVVSRDGALFRPIWTDGGRSLLCHWKVPGYSTEIRLLEISARSATVTREFQAPDTPLFVAQSVLPDERHLIAVGGRSLSAATIYLARYPFMTLVPITQGVAYWRSPSVSADGRRVVAVRVQQNYNLWIAADGDAEGRQLTSDLDAKEGIHGIGVTGDGEIIYTSTTNGDHNHVWIASPDGRRVRQLTSGDEDEFWPAASQSGAAIFYGQRHTAGTRSMRIWRMDLATGRPVQLTTGSWDMLPAVTPDGRQVIYTDGGGEQPVIKRIASSGGAPQTIAPGILFAPAVSPDGKQVAGFHAGTMSDARTLVTMRLDNGAIVRRFPVTSGSATLCVRWTPDGRGLVIAQDGEAADNLWLYPVSGGAPRQLTHFQSLEIEAFQLLPDGKHYVLSRGRDASDVVMIDGVLD